MLPLKAREILKKAAQTVGEFERRVAIDEANEYIRRRWPEYFREDDDESDDCD